MTPARRKPVQRSRLRAVAPMLAVGATVAVIGLGISRIDFGDAIREVTLPLRHDDIIRKEAGEKDLDPALVAGVIYVESRFRDQTSSAGARGLMQITPDTADTVERLSGGTTFVTEDLADPDINIAYGTYYMHYLLDRYGGNEVAALAAYNAGPGNVDDWGGSELDEQDIPFPETRSYVDQVLEKRDQYRQEYAKDLGLD